MIAGVIYGSLLEASFIFTSNCPSAEKNNNKQTNDKKISNKKISKNL